jgi:hypothetical protein
VETLDSFLNVSEESPVPTEGCSLDPPTEGCSLDPPTEECSLDPGKPKHSSTPHKVHLCGTRRAQAKQPRSY